MCGFRLARQLWIAFVPLFAISLTIVFFVFQARLDLLTLPARYIVVNTVLALLISLGAAALSLAGFCFLLALTRKVWRRIVIRIALHTLEQAVGVYTRRLQADGIDEQDGGVIIRLAIGSHESIIVGDKFEVLNAASRRKLGVLEVDQVEEVSCVCRVFDRIDVDFWAELEERMRVDPSPPTGVTFSREIPQGLLEFVTGLIRNWGG